MKKIGTFLLCVLSMNLSIWAMEPETTEPKITVNIYDVGYFNKYDECLKDNGLGFRGVELKFYLAYIDTSSQTEIINKQFVGSIKIGKNQPDNYSFTVKNLDTNAYDECAFVVENWKDGVLIDKSIVRLEPPMDYKGDQDVVRSYKGPASPIKVISPLYKVKDFSKRLTNPNNIKFSLRHRLKNDPTINRVIGIVDAFIEYPD